MAIEIGKQAQKSPQTVQPNGTRLVNLIDGVKFHKPVTHEDDRGSLSEIYHPSWNFDDLPIPAAYLVTIATGRVKGWAIHMEQYDRYFFATGKVKLVLYDSRPDSLTSGTINELYFGEINRALVLVPPGIYHAVENVGDREAMLFNIPDKAYRHEDPDKYTLPISNDFIPYEFKNAVGY